jgi:hypothetical protein
MFCCSQEISLKFHSFPTDNREKLKKPPHPALSEAERAEAYLLK